MRTSFDFTQILADAYFKAALTNADMQDTTEALETIRSTAETEDQHKIWDIMDEQIGKAEATFLLPVLLQLRRKFTRHFLESEISRLHTVFRQDPDAGWKDLLLTYAKALYNWRLQFSFKLVDEPFALNSVNYDEVKEISRYTKLALQERWAETYDLFVGLTRKELIPKEIQANFLVTAAEIQLYYLNPNEFSAAKTLLSRAEDLAPHEPRVFEVWGEYWLQQNELGKARENFQAAIKLRPQMSNSYSGIGECYEREGDLDAAEDWHLEAIRKASSSSAYTKLIDFYGRSKLLSARKERLLPLVERAIAVEPDCRYSTYAQLGYIYQEVGNYQESHQWFEKAIKLDKKRLGGYVGKGYTYVREEKYLQACLEFKKAIKVAPESFDGYWGLSLAQQRIGQYKEALQSYRKSLRLRPEWKEVIQEGIDTTEWELGKHNVVTRRLLKRLATEPENQKLTDRLLFFAGELYKTFDKDKGALQVYSKMRKTKGRTFEGEYHNLVGNLNYYIGDYEKAKKCYLEAIQNAPDTAVYHANLADAWIKLETPGRRIEVLNQSIRALKRACQLAPEDDSYRADLEALQKRASLITHFGEKVLEMPMPVVTPIAVEVADNLVEYIEGKGETDLTPQLTRLTTNLRKRVYKETGVRIPGIRFRSNANLESGTYSIILMETPITGGQIEPEKRLFCGNLQDVEKLGVYPDQTTVNPLTGSEAYWINKINWKKLEASNLELLDAIDYLVTHLEAEVRRNLAEFIDHQEIMNLLESTHCDACDIIRSSDVRLTTFVNVLQGLVTEGLPITPFKVISRTFNLLYDEGRDVRAIAERLRLNPAIRKKLPGNYGNFVFYRLGKRLEGLIYQSLEKDGETLILNMRPEDCLDIFGIAREKIRPGMNQAFLVDDPELRPFVRELMTIEFPDIPVLSRQELAYGLENNIKDLEPTGTAVDEQKTTGNFWRKK
jgi:tetratricopeptide (TPR) repeat protein